MGRLIFRAARREDLPTLVAMLADDELGALREAFEDPLPETYFEAFARIDGDPNQQLIVAESETPGSPVEIAGSLQLTLIPYLTYRGGWRALVEGVRVASAQRGEGVGRALLEEAIARARAHGCHLVQLTSDKRRPRAIGFYQSLGFEATHEGMKLHLDS